MNPDRIKVLKNILDQALKDFVESGEIHSDALQPALRYQDWHDRELAAFICAVIAYGRVEHIKKSIHRVLDPMGDRPHQWLMKATSRDLKKLTSDWSHRFNTAEDLLILLNVLKQIYTDFGSIESFVNAKSKDTAYEILENLVAGIDSILMHKLKIKPKTSFWFFLPRPSGGSACKRLNLYLRWMVGRGPLDFSLWKSVSTEALVIPLDVHVLKQAQSLRLTRRKQADWTAVIEVTESLRKLDSKDPVQYDFALCHLGMNGRVLKMKDLAR
jgi:uncharacterized protein (TIGR02757 family)